MIDVAIFLLAISFIILFGFFAEFIFQKLRIPDTLLLIILGFLIGPYGKGYIAPGDIANVAPVFVTFTLLFLLFDGAFNINLASLLKGLAPSLGLTFYNFILSAGIIAVIFKLIGFPITLALLTGFILGGTSSIFVIPILKQLRVKQKIYSLLTFESALSDVLCIVSAITLFEIIKLGVFGVQKTLTTLTSLFAVAAGIGIVGGIIWYILTVKVFKEHNYMVTIAYLLILYVITEFLGGNGAIAALFFGLFLKNSRQISSIAKGILTRKIGEKKKAVQGELGISVISPTEKSFYHQISFLLKTFFFIYIGILIDLSDRKALLVGGGIALALLLIRNADFLITKNLAKQDRRLVNSIFARGLAAAAIAQSAVIQNIPQAAFISKVTLTVITGTIILSSARIFLNSQKKRRAQPDAC